MTVRRDHFPDRPAVLSALIERTRTAEVWSSHDRVDADINALLSRTTPPTSLAGFRRSSDMR